MVASVGRITAGRGYDYLTREVATSKHDYYTGQRRGARRVDRSRRRAARTRAARSTPTTWRRCTAGSWCRRRPAAPGCRRAGGCRSRSWAARSSPRPEPMARSPSRSPRSTSTFSPSKSVSLLWGLTADERIRRPSSTLTRPPLRPGSTTSIETPGTPGSVMAVCASSTATGSSSPSSATARHAPPTRQHGSGTRSCTRTAPSSTASAASTASWRTLDSRAIYRHAHAAGAVYGAALEARAVGTARGVVGDTGSAGADARDRRHPAAA